MCDGEAPSKEDRPIAVTYEITDFGKTALGFLEELKDWVEQHQL
ncbi:MAG: hypothetical protein ACFB0D_14705 [Phormidesmis sp.]